LGAHRKLRPRERPYYRKGDRVHARADGPLLVREEQQLVEGLLAGNEDAVRMLYTRYARPVFTLGLRLLGTAEAAEELTQDVFLAAWRKAERFDPSRGRLSTWLMTIAHNLAVDRLRRETGVTRPTLVLVDEVPEVAAAGDEDPLLERDAAVRALQALSDAERKLLVRAYFGGLTAREIAEADVVRAAARPRSGRRTRTVIAAVIAAAIAVASLGWGAVMAGRAQRFAERAAQAEQAKSQALDQFQRVLDTLPFQARADETH